jgi:hypothetical protein
MKIAGKTTVVAALLPLREEETGEEDEAPTGVDLVRRPKRTTR